MRMEPPERETEKERRKLLYGQIRMKLINWKVLRDEVKKHQSYVKEDIRIIEFSCFFFNANTYCVFS